MVVASVEAEAALEPTPTPRKLAWHEDLMRQAGIAESDWYYTNCVIAGCEGIPGEGSWQGTTRWNYGGSGSYGICQALPASKMASAGLDYMTNTLTQLKWCASYAEARYSGWKQAWEFRKCVGKCWQPVYSTWIMKDHTWW